MVQFLNFFEARLPYNRILTIGLLLRLLIFIGACFFPIPFGPSPPISPLIYQVGTDLPQYIAAGKTYYMGIDGLNEFFKIYYNLFINVETAQLIPTGPFYPWILIAFDYSPSNTLPLSFFIFVLEGSAFILLCSLGKHILVGVPGLLFCLMPHPIWFGILISSDIFLYFFSSLFFYIYFTKKVIADYNLIFVTLVLILIRPMGALFCLALILIPKRKFCVSQRIGIFKSISFLLLIFSFIFYAPYFFTESATLKAGGHPTIANTSVTFSMFVYKFFSFFGIHSSSSQLFLAEAVRFFYGIIFLVGFFAILSSNRWLGTISFVLVVFSVLFLFAAWRYFLPFLPLFFIFGTDFLNKLLKRSGSTFPEI